MAPTSSIGTQTDPISNGISELQDDYLREVANRKRIFLKHGPSKGALLFFDYVPNNETLTEVNRLSSGKCIVKGEELYSRNVSQKIFDGFVTQNKLIFNMILPGFNKDGSFSFVIFYKQHQRQKRRTTLQGRCEILGRGKGKVFTCQRELDAKRLEMPRSTKTRTLKRNHWR